MLFFLILWFVSILCLTRTLLLLTGLLKSPILRLFEKYGDEESFLPMPAHFLGWSGLFISLSNFLLTVYWDINLNLGTVGFAFVITALSSYRWPRAINGPYGLVLNHPRWLAELVGRTTRAERRRLAYMWLRLPFKLRVIYNSDDRAFLEWADMVIMATFWA